jgi:hypothetical protein
MGDAQTYELMILDYDNQGALARRLRVQPDFVDDHKPAHTQILGKKPATVVPDVQELLKAGWVLVSHSIGSLVMPGPQAGAMAFGFVDQWVFQRAMDRPAQSAEPPTDG